MSVSKPRPVRRPTLKNDLERRMLNNVQHSFWMPEKVIRALDRRNLGYYIAELRTAETSARHLRTRLEALQAGVERVCAREGCERPVAGRADARYCSDRCRIYAHRESRRND